MNKYYTICWFILWIALFGQPVRAQQSWQWVSNAQGASGNNVVLASDGLGTTIVAGNFTGTLTLGAFTLTSAGNSDIFVAWLSATGTWMQAVRAGGPGLDYLYSLALDGAKNPVVSGSFSGTSMFGSTTLTSAGGTDLFVARLNASGTWTQAVRAGGTDDEYAQQIAVDSNSNVVVTGAFYTNTIIGATTLLGAGAADVYVAWLSATGNWTQAVRAGGPAFDSASSIALDAAGNLTIAGYFNNSATFGSSVLVSAGNTDLFVARLNPAGSWVQAVRAGSTDSDYGSSVIVDGAGNATVTGYFYGTTQVGTQALTSAGLADILVARLDAAGNWIQASRAGGPTLDVPGRLVSDSNGNVLVTGFFTGNADFGNTTLVSVGGRDIFLAALSPTGTWTQAVRAGGAGDDSGYDVVAGSNGSVIIGGLYTGNAAFGPYAITSNGTGAFVARFAGIALATRPLSAVGAFSIAPNPATTQVVIAWSRVVAEPQVLQVLDQLGHTVRTILVPAYTSQINADVKDLSSGIYFVKSGVTVGRLQIK